MDEKTEPKMGRWKQYEPELGLLLWAVWRPIPSDVPLDEYETYVPIVWKLLGGGATVEAIAAELSRLRVDGMGIEGGEEGDREAAQRLREWWYWRFEFPAEFEARS